MQIDQTTHPPYAFACTRLPSSNCHDGGGVAGLIHESCSALTHDNPNPSRRQLSFDPGGRPCSKWLRRQRPDILSHIRDTVSPLTNCYTCCELIIFCGSWGKTSMVKWRPLVNFAFVNKKILVDGKRNVLGFYSLRIKILVVVDFFFQL
jgi:hypothetical protein